MAEMTDKEKKFQRALGTMKKYQVEFCCFIGIPVDAVDEEDAQNKAWAVLEGMHKKDLTDCFNVDESNNGGTFEMTEEDTKDLL